LADDALPTRLDAAVTALQTQLDGWLAGHGRIDLSDVALITLDLELELDE
jgi:hypothetical protein